jgi:cell division topological specificity factor
MWNQIKTLFKGATSSRAVAKGRLHLVLAYDRTGLDGAHLQEMRRELAVVIAKYIEIDADALDIQIERIDRQSSNLRVSSPVRAR